MHDSELNRFKSDIPLIRYAIERYGYQRDARESSRSSHVLRHLGTGDKIVVRLNPDGHWTYFSVRDDRDNGTIVDFVKERAHHRSLGHVRQELRQWLGTPRPERHDGYPEVALAPPPDRRAVARLFAAARTPQTCPYLLARGIPPETLAGARFADTLRQDTRGNVLFAHRDDAGELTGFEIKNRGFTGFSPGGIKTAWQSAAWPEDRALVLTEGAIDALSYHMLHPQDAARFRYLSTAGAPSARQLAVIDRLLAKLPARAAVIAAVDADDAGSKLAAQLAFLSGLHPHLAFRRDSPTTDKDWNNVLQRTLREGARTRPEGPHGVTQGPCRDR